MMYECTLKQRETVFSAGSWRTYGQVWVQDTVPTNSLVDYKIVSTYVNTEKKKKKEVKNRIKEE